MSPSRNLTQGELDLRICYGGFEAELRIEVTCALEISARGGAGGADLGERRTAVVEDTSLPGRVA